MLADVWDWHNRLKTSVTVISILSLYLYLRS